MASTFFKDPNSTLDYAYDWAPLSNGNGDSDWLADGESIASFTIVADSGITVESSELINNNSSVRVWLSGGTVGTKYRVVCHIVTDEARIDDRTILLKIVQK